MGSYDLKRLEIAIQYIRRMSEGKNPVTNRPAPDNEVLNNMNVHRCLKFIDEVLTDVQKSGGTVGMVSQRAHKQSVSEVFPYDALAQYQYLQDQQISYFLKQLEEYLPEGQKMPVPATTITLWMRENGYLEKKVINDSGKENSVPTKKGEEFGLYMEKSGIYPNEYYRVYYNEKAQRFIIENFRRILTESEAIRERNRQEKKKEGSPRSARQSGGSARQSGGSAMQGGGADRRGAGVSGAQNPVGQAAYGNPSYASAAPLPEDFASSEPAPVEDLPQEYYDMLRDGWDSADGGAPW
ncbi:MAG: hypothetical protein IJ198_03890 [Lachnospiraceae bacterium]|nr:hypothetical protein [Lachnospiraceae bacterium]